jgi:phosphoglycerate dehydrogenase-like enzyme
VKILCASPIDSSAIDELSQSHEVVPAWAVDEDLLRTLITDAEILVFRSGVEMSPELLETAPSLRMMIRAGSGLDNVDIEYVRGRGLRLVRVPGPGAQAVAELTLGLILGVSRHLMYADRSLRAGHWPKHQLAGTLLDGKRLGIVGVGSIGSRVARLAGAVGMDVIGCIDPRHESEFDRLRSIGVIPARLEEVVSTSDFVTIHTPLNDRTHHLFDSGLLSLMKQGSFLINTSRGGVVDEKALYAELTEGDRLAGAALDVHELEGEGVLSPFADLRNVVLTPHIGAMARDSQREIGKRVLAMVAAFERGQLDAVVAVEERVV